MTELPLTHVADGPPDTRDLARAVELADLAWRGRSRDPRLGLLQAREACCLTSDVRAEHGSAAVAARARAQIALGACARRTGDYDTGLAAGEEGRLLAASLADSELEARALGVLGEVHYSRGAEGRAAECFAAGLAVRAGAAPAQIDAELHNGLGRVQFVLGHYARAHEHFNQAHTLSQEIGYTLLAAVCSVNLGNVLSELNDHDGALASYRQAMALQREIHDEPGVALTLYNVALLYKRRGDREQALETIDEARRLWAQGRDADLRTRATCLAAVLRAGLGERDEALRLIDEAIRIEVERGNVALHGECLTSRGEVMVALGDEEVALADYRRSVELLSSVEQPTQLWRCHADLAQLVARRGDPAEAIALLAPDLDAILAAGGKGEIITHHRLLAEAYEALGDDRAALRCRKVQHEHEGGLWAERSEVRVRRLKTDFELEQAHFRAECLREEKARLEAEVAARTAELLEANQRLRREIEERERAAEERRRLEETLRQRQRMEALGELAGGVAHDFNNLLTVISGYSEILVTHLGPADRLGLIASEIQEAGDRASALTRQLLAFSRRTVIEPSVMDLNALVGENERLLRRLIGEDMVMVTTLDPRVLPVLVDPGQIGQLIMNLAINARDAMAEGGALTIATASARMDAAFVAAHPEARVGEYALLAVTDTGHGMTPEVKAHIFEPFFTTKGPGLGTGLGLATVYGIAKQCGGFVYVESEPGRGTTFRVYLPRATAPLEPPRPSALLAATASGTETILLAEDDRAVRSIVGLTLRQSGYTVLEAAGGTEALAVAASHRGPIHLLLTDVIMPNTGGSFLVKELLALRPQMRAIYTSGHSEDSLDRYGIVSGEVVFLQKPFTMASLMAKVRSVLDA